MSAERGQTWLRVLDRWLGIPLTVPAMLMRRVERRSRTLSGRIGILCLGAIGDLLLLSGLVDGIKRHAPECSIDLMVSSANAVALPLIPDISAHFTAPLRRVDKFIVYARQRRFDVFFDAGQWARVGSLIAAFSGASLTVGFRTGGQYRSLPYDIAVEHSGERHETENFLALGRAVWPALTGKPHLVLPAWNGRDIDKTVYCHMWPAPGRGRELKQWPPQLWAALVEKLLESGYVVKLTGAKADADECRNFLQKYFPDEASAQSIAGKTNLVELAGLFQKATAIVSVNTGIMHLAALSGAPCIGLHGATNPLRWGPVGENCVSLLPRGGECGYLNLGFEYPHSLGNAMFDLPVSDVLAGLRSLGVKV